MDDKYLSVVIDHLVRRGVASLSTITGCSREEVQELRRIHEKLPLAYECFLLRMGKGAGSWFRGSDIYYPVCLELNDWAEELLNEQPEPRKLPVGTIVFGMDQGYQFHFIKHTEGDDPPVYYYHEAANKFELYCESFSSFMIQCASGHPGKR